MLNLLRKLFSDSKQTNKQTNKLDFLGLQGFTILELLVVIAVLATLIAVAIPRFKGMQQNGNVAKANKEIKTIIAALESYRTFDSSRSFPLSTSAITNLQSTYLINASPSMLSSVLYDPFAATATTEYKYMSSSTAKYFVVWSAGLPGQSAPTGISDTGTVSF